MRTRSSDADLSPEEVSRARQCGIILALANQALRDSDYTEALIIAAANVIGMRSVTNGAPVEDVLGVIRNIAGDVVAANRPRVLQ